jgi:hypothetical protein
MNSVPFYEALEDCSRSAGKVPQASCLPNGEIPVIGQGKQPVEGYTNDRGLAFRGDLPVVLFGDHTAAFKFIDQPFARGADGTKLFRPKNDKLDAKFAWHFLQTVRLPQTGYDRKTKYLESIEIPLPPLEEQRRIAAILDKADVLEALAEKATRLHERLIDAFFLSRVGNPAREDWQARQAGSMRLSDIAHIKTGKLDANAANPNGQYPFFTCSKTTLSIDSYCFEGEAVLVAGNGDLNVKRHSGRLNAYQRTYIISPKSTSPEEADYIYSLLRLYVARLRMLSIGGVIKYIKLPFLSDLPVGPIDSGVAREISSLQRSLLVGSSLRTTASSKIGSLASSLATGLMKG